MLVMWLVWSWIKEILPLRSSQKKKKKKKKRKDLNLNKNLILDELMVSLGQILIWYLTRQGKKSTWKWLKIFLYTL